MAFQIKKIRKKRKWTGKEVGLALIMNTLNDIKNKGNEHEPLFSQEEFQKMESSLVTEKEFQIYSIYRSLYSSILRSYNAGLGLYQQFSNGYTHLFAGLCELQSVENAQRIFSKWPFIMTEAQYSRLEKMIPNTQHFPLMDLDPQYAIREKEKAILGLALEEQGRKCRNRTGIAVIKNPSPAFLDEKGHYINEDPFSPFANLEELSKSEDIKRNIHAYQHHFIYNALRYFYAYNALLGLLEKVYDIDGLQESAQLNIPYLEGKMDGFNDALCAFFNNVYGTEEEKEEKRVFIETLYSPLDKDDAKPLQKNIDAVAESLMILGYSNTAARELKYLDSFIERIMKAE